MKHLISAFLFGSLLVSCQTTRPFAVTSNKVSGKKAKNCYKNALYGIIPLSKDDTSIYTTARKGRIKKISTVDREYFTFLGLYNESCTIVHGS